MSIKIDSSRLKQWESVFLPGKHAQDIMLPHPSRNKYKVADNHKKAGVMILLFEEEKQWNFVLIKRTYHPKDKHAGQISFPGGKLDTTDKDMIQCAIRETHEEVGILPKNIHFMQSLTPIYVPVSQFMVYPQIGCFTGDKSAFNKQDDEVEELIFVSLEDLLDNNSIQKMDMTIMNQNVENVPFFSLNNQVVWGATAMILSEFKSWVKEVMNKTINK